MLRVGRDVPIGDVIKTLRELAVTVENVRSTDVEPEGVRRCRDAYLRWADTAERTVRPWLGPTETASMLQTTRYWHIRELDLSSARPAELIGAEIDLQASELRRLADELEKMATRLSAPPGRLVVLDTHVLLHYQPAEQVDWPAFVGPAPLRLVLPLRVIEELDAKKYARRNDLADTARRVLRHLDDTLLPSEGAPVKVRPGVTLEVPVEPDLRERRRPQDADSEILSTCWELEIFTGRPVTLVSGDTGIRLRALAGKLPVVTMPAKYERKSHDVTAGPHV